jgi:mannose-P-dolichol utilization defect protein 1
VLGSEHCYKTIVEDLNVTDVECLKLVLSKGLGFGIVAGGSIVKVPQILKLISSGSGEGVSVLSYFLETAAFVITLAYNFRQGFPFSTYGETLFIVVQNVIILLLVLSFKKKFLTGLGVVLGLVGAYQALVGDSAVPFSKIQFLQSLTIPIALGSKLPQIFAIHKNKSTGQLSAFAVFNYLLGSLARIYTTMTEVNDPLIFWGFLLSTVLNGVLVVQMIKYWNAPATKKHAFPIKVNAVKGNGKNKKRM